TILTDDTPYTFKSAGEKEAAVTYGTLTARYFIIVRSDTETPAGSGSGSASSSGGASIGIDIQWD
ncbi:MAG: hypothetical protein LBP81_09910, partial [Treponema sp.]|nr:hypothetical protein [Treponema sp.]